MYFCQATALALALLLSASQSAAAPISRRAGGLSKSYADLSKPVLSPYYTYFGNPKIKPLSQSIKTPGLKAATLGFIVAPSGQCQPTTDLNTIQKDVPAYIAAGGAINLSFGGAISGGGQARQHVQQACKDVASLQKLITDQMKAFNTHNIEFDIEDDDLLSDSAAAKRLAQALAAIKKSTPDVYITYTLATTNTGMTDKQTAQVQAAKDAVLELDSVTLMTMDMGGLKDINKDSQTAATGGAKQVAKIYSISQDEAMAKMGVLPSIGVDDTGVVLTVANAKLLAQWAKDNKLARVSYWNLNRDFAGDVGSKETVQSSSAPDQKQDYQFFTTMQQVLGGGSTSGSGNSTGGADGANAGGAKGKSKGSGTGTGSGTGSGSGSGAGAGAGVGAGAGAGTGEGANTDTGAGAEDGSDSSTEANVGGATGTGASAGGAATPTAGGAPSPAGAAGSSATQQASFSGGKRRLYYLH